jgi:hypothetical protein
MSAEATMTQGMNVLRVPFAEETSHPLLRHLHEARMQLLQARDLILAGWCQHALALDASGHTVGSRSAAAVSWCAIGAMNAIVVSKDAAESAWSALQIATDYPPSGISLLNDAPHMTQEKMAALFAKAIEILDETVRKASHDKGPSL